MHQENNLKTENFPKEIEVNPPSAIQAFKSIRRANGEGVNASEGQKYQHLFGRDSLQIADDILAFEPEIAKEVILTLAKYQGTGENIATEESIGKILHEKRDNDKAMYVAADSTPMFVNLVHDYAQEIDTNILNEKVTKKDGKTETLADCAYKAADWIVKNINEFGLVEVDRRRLENFYGQVWKDSLTAYLDTDGRLINVRGGIVFPEIQALSYDALTNAAELCNTTDEPSANAYRQRAEEIRTGTLNHLWNDEAGFFVSCLEEDKSTKKLNPIKTFESSAGRMLNSKLFDNMPEQEKQKYVKPIVSRLFSKDFLTDAGIRSRSYEHKQAINISDYHGSDVCWQADTYVIAKGLRKQNLPLLAEQLENRILNSANMSGMYYEFNFVDKDGSMLVDYKSEKHGEDGQYDVQFAPERNQGWTISAALAIKKAHGRLKNGDSSIIETSWENGFQNSILFGIKQIPLYKTKQELKENYPDKQDIKLNAIRGLGKTVLYLAKQLPGQWLSAVAHHLKN